MKKGTNKGEVTLILVGSYYGDPDNFPAIVHPFLDAMVRVRSRIIILRNTD